MADDFYLRKLANGHPAARDANIHTSQMKGNYFVGRGEADAPDIDGRVYVRVPRSGMTIGQFAKVKIVGHTDYDLIAEPVTR